MSTMRSLEDLTEQQILAMLNPAEPRVRAGNPGAEMLRQMYLPPPQEPISYDALRERLAQLRPMNVTNPPGATMPLGMQEPENTPQVLGTPQAPLTPAQQTIAGQPPADLPPIQEVTPRPLAPVTSVPMYQPPAPPQQAAALPAPVSAQQAAAAPAAPSSGVSGNTLLGLAAITDAFAILGGRQPTMLAQMAPIAQQRSQREALERLIEQRRRGALSPEQATILGNAVQQAGAVAGAAAPQAAGGEAPYGGGFSARGLAINTQIESGGNATAQNPRSSAYGANQFIASTWNEFARANPDLFRGMSQEEILAARANPELSAQATQWNARRNSEVLSNANLPVNDATLGIAHMFGAQGATQILRSALSNPTARMEDVVTADVLRANPNLAGRTVGDVAGEFGRRYAPAALTPEQRAIAAPTAAAPGVGAPGTALRPRTVPMTTELAETLLAMPDSGAALRFLTQLDLQAAQQRGSRILSDVEARSIYGTRWDPNKLYEITQEGTPRPVAGTVESEEPTRQQLREEAGKLRNEFGQQKPVQEFLSMGPQILAIRDGVARERPSRLNDISLTFAFAKMLDPTSVVRENEAGQIVASASVADRLSGYIARLNGSAVFSPELRAQLLREAEGRYSSARSAYDVEADAFTELARRKGVNPEFVIPPRRNLPEAQPIPGSPEAQAGQTRVSEAQRPQAITRLQDRVRAGEITLDQARSFARSMGIPDAERFFQ